MGTSQEHSMLAVRGLTLALVLGSMAACDTSSSSVVQTTGPDCPAQLRYHGATYTAFQRYRFAHEQPTKLGAATPVCVGTTIPAGDPITVWSVPGGPPAEVIGRRVYPKRFVVYVADSVKRSDRAQVLAAMAATRRWPPARACKQRSDVIRGCPIGRASQK